MVLRVRDIVWALNSEESYTASNEVFCVEPSFPSLTAPFVVVENMVMGPTPLTNNQALNSIIHYRGFSRGLGLGEGRGEYTIKIIF